jgi:hypothetical protein
MAGEAASIRTRALDRQRYLTPVHRTAGRPRRTSALLVAAGPTDGRQCLCDGELVFPEVFLLAHALQSRLFVTQLRGEPMSEHHIVLQIDVAEGIEPEVRMWLDDQQTCDLESEREVRLTRSTARAWTARFEAKNAFFYRIGIAAAPGCRWSLSLHDATQRELLFDSDELTMTKEWLLGSCDPQDLEPPKFFQTGAFGEA